jgi:hypothetical protein
MPDAWSCSSCLLLLLLLLLLLPLCGQATACSSKSVQ